MTTLRQLLANRQNAKKSSGPRTNGGKQRSRRNAYKHGLTAEAVVASFENLKEYRVLEKGLVAERQPSTLIERALVLRLASLLWRLKRAAAIEKDLFEAQGRSIQARKISKLRETQRENNPGSFKSSSIMADTEHGFSSKVLEIEEIRAAALHAYEGNTGECFFHLATDHGPVLERLEKYEGSIWKQVAQTVLLLDSQKN